MSHLPRPPEILVVDGDSRTARVLGLLLGEDGFHVDVVSDGLAAAARFNRRPLPDALICGSWPGHVDDDAASLARARSPDLPVFVITTRPDQHWKTLRGPAIKVVTKPIDYPSLLAELRAAVDPRKKT